MNRSISLFIACAFLIVCSGLSCSKNTDNQNLITKFYPLSTFDPPKTVKAIDPAVKNSVTGKKGIRLNIPADVFDLPRSFKKGDTVNIELTEVLDSFDYLVSGIGLNYTGLDGQPALFESGGMYNVRATFKDKNIKLKKGKKIEVQMPSLVKGEEYGMYRLDDDGRWEYNGHNQEAPSSGTRFSERRIVVAQFVKTEVGVRIYEIDELTWWNLDYPDKDTITIEGLIVNGDEKAEYQVIVFGVEVRSVYSTVCKGKKFAIRSLKKYNVRILVLGKDGKCGKSGVFRTPEEKSMKIKDIEVKELEKSILENQQKFEDYLELKRPKYDVKYKAN
jgi:hypothetical protein